MKAHEENWEWSDGAPRGIRVYRPGQHPRYVFRESKDTTSADIALAKAAPRMARLLLAIQQEPSFAAWVASAIGPDCELAGDVYAVLRDAEVLP